MRSQFWVFYYSNGKQMNTRPGRVFLCSGYCWECLCGLARVSRSGIPTAVHLVLAGGGGDSSPQLQHELIIPQWKTSERFMREKVRLKSSCFQKQKLATDLWSLGSSIQLFWKSCCHNLFLTHCILSVLVLGLSFIVWQTSRILPNAISWGNENPH